MAKEQNVGVRITSDKDGIRGIFVRTSGSFSNDTTKIDRYFKDTSLKNGGAIEYGTPRSPQDFLVRTTRKSSLELVDKPATTSEAAALMSGVRLRRSVSSLTDLEVKAKELLEERLGYMVQVAKGDEKEMKKR